MKSIIAVAVILILTMTPDAQQKFAQIGNLELESGETIENCQIGYRTFGKINSDSTNIIIYPTWFEGKSEHLETLIKKYQFIDTTKYFVIAIDALGNSVSTSPSNYDENDFPSFTIQDMVKSQFIMLTQLFGFKNIFAIIGGSMGAMQAYEWAVSYPEYAEKIIPYVGTPRLTSYDLMLQGIMLDIIEQSYNYEIPEGQTLSLIDRIMNSHAYTPEYRVENTSREDFDNFMTRFNKEGKNYFPLIDFYYQLKAMIAHNIASKFHDSMEEAANIVQADLLIIQSMTDILVNPIPSIEFAELTGAEILKLDNNCGHIAVNCEMEKVKTKISEFLKK